MCVGVGTVRVGVNVAVCVAVCVGVGTVCVGVNVCVCVFVKVGVNECVGVGTVCVGVLVISTPASIAIPDRLLCICGSVIIADDQVSPPSVDL